jgi:chromosome segregation ATPase
MDSNQQYTHPSLLLVNDEILSTQVRLMELYVKQAQAMATNEAARAQERFQAELTALQEELTQKELALETQQALSHQADQNLRAEVRELRARLLASQCSLQVRQTELEFAKSDAHVLRQRIAQSESTVQKVHASIEIEVARARETWQEELSALEGQLEKRESELQLLQASVKEVEGKLRVKIQDLGAQLAAKADLLKNRTDELQTAQRETALLRQQMQQFALTGAQTEAAASEAIRIREALQAELGSLWMAFEQKDLALQQNHAATKALEERLNAQLSDLQSQLVEKQGLLETRSQEIGELTARTNDLQEQITCLELVNQQTVKEAQAEARALEDSLRARFRELEASVSEKAQLLQNRTAELESAQSETALLRQSIEQLELTGTQTEAAKNEAERMREALQADLGKVRSLLEQKDASLAQRQTELRESSEHLNTQLSNLQTQLAERQQLLEVKAGELRHALARTVELEERILQVESLHNEIQATTASEVEHIRRESESERAALLTSLREKEQALQQHQAAIAKFEANFEGQLQDLRNQLAQKQELLEHRDREFQKVQSETALLRERIAQLESTADETRRTAAEDTMRIRSQFQAELATLQARLQEKELELAEGRAQDQEYESRLQAQTHEHQIEIAKKQLLLETRSVEIGDLQSKLRSAFDQMAQLELVARQAAAATSNAEIARQKLETELAARQEHVRNMERALAERQAQADGSQQTFNAQLGDLQTQLAEKQRLLETRSQEIGELTAQTNDLQEQIIRLELANKQTVKEAQAAGRAVEDSLRARLEELEATVSEKAQLLQNRTAELESAQSETALLRQSIEQLELTGTQTEAAKNEAERMREALQAELDKVRSLLEQKDASLAQRQTELRKSSEHLNTQLSNLQTQLAEERGLLENQRRELQSARSEIAVLQERLHELDSAKASAETSAALDIERFREQYQTELAGLRADLDQRQLALEQHQTKTRFLEEKLNAEAYRLEAQLAEKQNLLNRSDAELQEKQSEISALREEIAQSELARRHTEMLAAVQAKQIREQVKVEVGTLDVQLVEKENALKVLADRARELESVFNARIDDLHLRLAEKQSLVDSRDLEMTDLRSQISGLLAQINHLERANAQALEKQRVAASSLDQSLRVQVNELQNQLTEKLAALESRNNEVRRLESQISGFIERIGQAEVALKQTEANAASELAQIRQQSQAELAARQAEIDRKVETLQERQVALDAAEQNFQVEMDGLRAEVTEKHSLLESRNEELLRVKTELDSFQERIIYLESVVKEAERESPDKREHTGEYAGTALDTLWEELSQKERKLEERQAAVNDLEQGFQAEINDLRSELAEKQALLENPSKGFLIGDPTLTEVQKEKLNRLEQLVETIKADNEQTLISPHNRRWRFSLGRKRRWKS